MKLKFLFLLLFCATFAQSQILSSKVAGVDITNLESYNNQDSIPSVVYKQDKMNDNRPLIIVNGKNQKYTSLQTVNPDWIESIEVKKSKNPEDGIYEHGEVHIFMKAKHKMEWISLNELKKKYIEDSDLPTMFMLDDEFISEAYESFFVDEKNILKLEVSEINQVETGIKFQLVQLLTRSKENIEKANEIRLKGNN